MRRRIVYEDSGIWLVKRWDPSKGVDHYVVGMTGTWPLRVERLGPTIVQLLPSGPNVAPWVQGQGWNVVGRAPDPARAIERLIATWGTRFDLVNNNCEHFARYVVSGTRESQQVQVGVALVGLGLAIVLARS
jgi:hypothetical protein